MQQHRPQPSSKIFYKKAELQIRSSAFFMFMDFSLLSPLEFFVDPKNVDGRNN